MLLSCIVMQISDISRWVTHKLRATTYCEMLETSSVSDFRCFWIL